MLGFGAHTSFGDKMAAFTTSIRYLNSISIRKPVSNTIIHIQIIQPPFLPPIIYSLTNNGGFALRYCFIARRSGPVTRRNGNKMAAVVVVYGDVRKTFL